MSKSQIFAYQTNKYSTLHASYTDSTVLSKSNSYFNAQTPNYDTSTIKKLDVNARSNQSPKGPSMDITANTG